MKPEVKHYLILAGVVIASIGVYDFFVKPMILKNTTTLSPATA